MNIVSQGSNWVHQVIFTIALLRSYLKFNFVAFGVLKQWVYNNEILTVMDKSRDYD